MKRCAPRPTIAAAAAAVLCRIVVVVLLLFWSCRVQHSKDKVLSPKARLEISNISNFEASLSLP